MSNHSPQVIPAIRYADAPAAIDFLTSVFGFEVNARHDGENGRVDHAQLTFGTGMVMVGSRSGDQWDTERVSVYVVTDDPDTLHDRAREAGAEIVMGLTDQDYGSRDFAARDPEGNMWVFGTYQPEM
jgi:uncharacterized glyoxalase superfamily protein PhnB